MNIVHLSEKYELNELEKQIVSYIEKHQHELKSIGIRQMAKDNYTSTSVIYKLCSKFGFDGYIDMIYQLSSIDEETDFTVSLYKEKLDSIINDKSRRIVVFGLGFSSPVAEYMQQRLTLLGYPAMSVVHMEMFDPVFHNDTVFIVISYSGMTPRLKEIVTYASKNNIPVISFLGNQDCDIFKSSSLPVIVGHYNSFSHDLNRPMTFYGEVIIAFETLFFH